MIRSVGGFLPVLAMTTTTLSLGGSTRHRNHWNTPHARIRARAMHTPTAVSDDCGRWFAGNSSVMWLPLSRQMEGETSNKRRTRLGRGFGWRGWRGTPPSCMLRLEGDLAG